MARTRVGGALPHACRSTGSGVGKTPRPCGDPTDGADAPPRAGETGLFLQDAVLCYRHKSRIERFLNRLKSRVHIAPLFVKRNEHIEGLTYLLTLGVRV